MVMRVKAAFAPEEIDAVYRTIRERRDVRCGFLATPLEEPVLQRLLHAAHCGPSVGLMQPARFIVVRDPTVRQEVHRIFSAANEAAAANYDADRKELYQR